MDKVDKAQQEQIAINNNRLLEITNSIKTKGSKVCIDCDQPIPKSRRCAYPAAVRCIDCASYHEKIHEKNHGKY